MFWIKVSTGLCGLPLFNEGTWMKDSNLCYIDKASSIQSNKKQERMFTIWEILLSAPPLPTLYQHLWDQDASKRSLPHCKLNSYCVGHLLWSMFTLGLCLFFNAHLSLLYLVISMAASTEDMSSPQLVDISKCISFFLPNSSCCHLQKLSSIFSPWCPIYISAWK